MNAKTYNGHKNYNHWNVSLWINNDASLYSMAKFNVSGTCNLTDAARGMLADLHELGMSHTPDGAPYSVSSIKAALRDING
jgi:hypothetical protein